MIVTPAISVASLLPLPAFAISVEAGAARFGRRTPEPHVWPAASYQVMRGGYHRGVGMASEQDDWVQALRPVDQKAARRVLDAAGSESTLRRIFEAFTNAPHKKGRPPLRLRSEHLVSAFSLFLRTEKKSFKQIAREVIDADESITPAEKAGLVRKLQLDLSKEVKYFQWKLLGDEHGNVLSSSLEYEKFLLKFQDLLNDGVIVREPYKAKNTSKISYYDRVVSKLMGDLNEKKDQYSSIYEKHTKNIEWKKGRIESEKERMERVKRLVSFIAAFDCLSASVKTTPISKMATLYNHVEHFLLDEIQTATDRTKKS